MRHARRLAGALVAWGEHLEACDRCRLAAGLGATRADLRELCRGGGRLAAQALGEIARASATARRTIGVLPEHAKEEA